MSTNSRLDRLLQLIQTNTTSAEVKQTAAYQISLILKGTEITLFPKLIPLILSKNYDIRVTAAYLIGLIAEGIVIRVEASEGEEQSSEAIESLDAGAVLNEFNQLLATSFSKYNAGSAKTLAISQQTNEIKKALGLDNMDDDLIQETDLISNEDAKVQKRHIIDSVAPLLAVHMVTSWEKFYSFLITCVYSEDWEQRHGALLCLKELILNVHESNINQLLYRLMNVLLLDRFSDFNNDNRVMPCLESASQCLTLVLNRLVKANSSVIIEHFILVFMELLELGYSLRYAIASVLKYLFLNEYFVDRFLSNPNLVDYIVKCLSDEDDDLVFIVSQSLLNTYYASEGFASYFEELTTIVFDKLVDSLKNSNNDLSSASYSVLELISKLVSTQINLNKDSLNDLAKILTDTYPRHIVYKVRVATIDCLKSLTCSHNVLDRMLLNVLLDDTDVAQKSFDFLISLCEKSPGIIADFLVYNFNLEKWCQLAANPLFMRLNTQLLSLPDGFNPTDDAMIKFDLLVFPLERILYNRFLLVNLCGSMAGSCCSFKPELKEKCFSIAKLFTTTGYYFHLFLMGGFVDGIANGMKNKDADFVNNLSSPCYEVLYKEVDRIYHELPKTNENYNDEFAVIDQRALCSVASGLVALGKSVFGVLDSSLKKLNPIIRNLINGIKLEAFEFLRNRNAKSLAKFLKDLFKYGGQEKVIKKILSNLQVFLCNSYTSMINRESNCLYDGASCSLKSICEEFGSSLFDDLPVKENLFVVGKDALQSKSNILFSTQLVKTLDVKILLEKIYVTSFVKSILDFTTSLIVTYPVEEQGHLLLLACLLISTLCKRIEDNRELFLNKKFAHPIIFLLENYLTLMSHTDDSCRKSIISILHNIIVELQIKSLPYLVLFLVPLLGRLHDQNEEVRTLANKTFGLMMTYLPLENSDDSNVVSKEEIFLGEMLLKQKNKERMFIKQLVDPSKIDLFELPVRINASLRSYQQDGLNWLMFLNRYKLHGVLCDDMGLGKTLQSICAMASDHFSNKGKYRLPSLVVCPNSVTGHWKYEIIKYTHRNSTQKQDGDKPYYPLKPLLYIGASTIRQQLKHSFTSYDVIITSYETVRNDLHYLEDVHFNYIILDEGHTIKNSKSKITLAIKSLKCNHRLILSGTPIQNNVLELWSLFDFLMPGFLGSEKDFEQKYSKPIQLMKGVKVGKKEKDSGKKDRSKIIENGTLALESLHRQVLPFLLRRMKEQVLKDLPPKIIQDYYCEMSPVQKIIYSDFLREEAQVLTKESDQKKGSHIFSALIYLRKLCNHPVLVYQENLEDHVKDKVDAELSRSKSFIDDLDQSPKLVALQELLHECGIKPVNNKTDSKSSSELLLEDDSVPSRHRILIFCQMKVMLDMIEFLLFKKHMPYVTYMRMDGSTPVVDRQEICFKFNDDPSIDVLLLTTQVGGLGLNLTGADTVIFVEHDWNPSKDMQAMDRAHRLGQKNVVNVYRLITKDTLEEKIMGLQAFKINIANTIVNQENTFGLQGMGSEQILDLFKVNNSENGNEDAAKKKRKTEDGGSVSVNLGGGISSKVLNELNSLTSNSNTAEEYSKEFEVYLDRLKKGVNK